MSVFVTYEVKVAGVACEKDVTIAILDAEGKCVASANGATGEMTAFDLRLGELTEEERQIILKGCLINYNNP